MNKKWIITTVLVMLSVAFLVWLFIESSKPLPGQKIDDLGRGHIAIGTKIEYNSNPPTSGKHYEDWIKSGVYDSPRDDRNLVHSLEHGYIIMSYNCSKQGTGYRVQGTVYALEAAGEASSSSEATNSANLSEEFKSEDCQKLIGQLTAIYNSKHKSKLIVIPRPNLDSKIALTAWRYLDKFDPSTSSGLSVSEIGRIEKFIDAHRDNGPEKTMEP